MKTKLSVLAIITLLVGSSWISNVPAKVQPAATTVKTTNLTVTPAFDFFRAHRQTRNGATVTWGFSTCSGVEMFEVQRNVFFPIEDWAWEPVSMTSCSGARSYKFTDAPIEAGYNSYRVVAHMTDGSEVISDMSTIRIISH